MRGRYLSEPKLNRYYSLFKYTKYPFAFTVKRTTIMEELIKNYFDGEPKEISVKKVNAISSCDTEDDSLELLHNELCKNCNMFYEKEEDEGLCSFVQHITSKALVAHSHVFCISIRISSYYENCDQVLSEVEAFKDFVNNENYQIIYAIYLDDSIPVTNIKSGILDNYSFIDIWVGEKYYESAYKIGLLLDSVYCTHCDDCDFFYICTNKERKNSYIGKQCKWPNEICELPDYKDNRYDSLKYGNMVLRYNITKYILGERHRNDTKAARALCYALGLTEENYFKHITAKEYIDFYLPQINTDISFTSNRDFESFFNWVNEKKIQIVHVCGEKIRNIILEKLESIGYKWKHLNDDYYITSVTDSDGNNKLWLLCSYHPRANKYYDNGLLHKNANNLIDILKDSLKEKNIL